MTLFLPEIEAEYLSKRVGARMHSAFTALQAGLLLTEEAYMSHFNEKVGASCLPDGRSERSDPPLLILHDLKVLHRKGKNRRDEYGADLALRLQFHSNPPKSKIAFFQFKLSESDEATLDVDQLHDLATEPLAGDRGFVVFVDRETGESRIADAKSLWLGVPREKQIKASAVGKGGRSKVRHTVDTSDASLAGDWMRDWFRCSIGKLAETKDQAHELFADPAFQPAGSLVPLGEAGGRLGDMLIGETLDVQIERPVRTRLGGN